MNTELLTWLGIGACVLHSALFSGLNLALFSVSRMRLEIEVEKGNRDAQRILRMREDANFLLTTILWGNVAVNCLLTLLSDSVLAGAAAFAFSTLGITIFGEIVPQAYFSRNALRVGSLFAPVLRFYQLVLYPLARPTAMLLDAWLGPEGMTYLRERDLRAMISKHMQAEEADLDPEEGVGALNFLELDDVPVSEEGEPVDPSSIIALPVRVDLPQFPAYEARPDDPFVRGLFTHGDQVDPYESCHRPIVVRDPKTPVGDVLPLLAVRPEHPGDDVIDQDLVLLWGEAPRILTGADLLGRLLRGISKVSPER